MDKYRNRSLAPIILWVLLLTCFTTTHVQSRILEEVEMVKIHANGLCVLNSCDQPSVCYYCCLVKDQCYGSVDECKADCPKISPLEPAPASTILAPSPPI
ncbi:hypothetical protein VPH35_048550 [Triticum aestivum]